MGSVSCSMLMRLMWQRFHASATSARHMGLQDMTGPSCKRLATSVSGFERVGQTDGVRSGAAQMFAKQET